MFANTVDAFGDTMTICILRLVFVFSMFTSVEVLIDDALCVTSDRMSATECLHHPWLTTPLSGEKQKNANEGKSWKVKSKKTSMQTLFSQYLLCAFFGIIV